MSSGRILRRWSLVEGSDVRVGVPGKRILELSPFLLFYFLAAVMWIVCCTTHLCHILSLGTARSDGTKKRWTECLEPSAKSVLFSHYWSQMLLSQPQETNVPPRQVFAPKCLLSSRSLLALPSPSSVVNPGVPLSSCLHLCGAPCIPSASVDPAQDGYGHPGPFSERNYNWEKLVGLGQTTELKQCWREPSGRRYREKRIERRQEDSVVREMRIWWEIMLL